jgi:hypothetical protein
MARFILSVLPDGRAVLTTVERLSEKQAFDLRGAIDGWRDGRWPFLVIPECETVQVAEIEIEVDVDRAIEVVT